MPACARVLWLKRNHVELGMGTFRMLGIHAENVVTETARIRPWRLRLGRNGATRKPNFRQHLQGLNKPTFIDLEFDRLVINVVVPEFSPSPTRSKTATSQSDMNALPSSGSISQ